MTDISKEKKTKLVRFFQSRPRLVYSIAVTISFLARLVTPLYYVYASLLKKYKQVALPLSGVQRSALKSKIDNYLWMMESDPYVFDRYGFIESDKCDSLLFTGLIGAVGRRSMILAARDKNGAWHRRSVDRPCYPQFSGSTISRDMLLGLLWYIWRNKNLDIANDLWDYGVKHRWIMGEGDPSRIYFTPGLQATLAEIIFRLGGDNHWYVRNLPQTWTGSMTGYRAHLEILHIMLRGELLGYINGPMLSALEKMDKSMKNMNTLNTLAMARYYQHAKVNKNYYANALNEILSEQYWPNDRLPSDIDRVTRWIPEMDIDEWLPGKDPNKEFSGGDLLFCANIALDYSKES